MPNAKNKHHFLLSNTEQHEQCRFQTIAYLTIPTSFLIKCQNLQVNVGNHWACEIALEKCKLCQMAANCQMVVASLYEAYYRGTRGL